MTKGSIQTLLSESHLVVGSYKIELPVNNDPSGEPSSKAQTSQKVDAQRIYRDKTIPSRAPKVMGGGDRRSIRCVAFWKPVGHARPLAGPPPRAIPKVPISTWRFKSQSESPSQRSKDPPDPPESLGSSAILPGEQVTMPFVRRLLQTGARVARTSARPSALASGSVVSSSISSQVVNVTSPQNSLLSTRNFADMPPPPTSVPDGGAPPPPPTALTAQAALGAQSAMQLFVEHGLGKRKLESIAGEKETTSLVDRWQKMVAAYLETQCHVIALLGYQPNEQGIALYTQHLNGALQLASPDIQEEIRVGGRDTYRMVLAAAFNLPDLLEDQKKKGELSVVDARNIMHKVSLRMQDPDVLEKVAKKCSTTVAMNDSAEAKQIELAHKHTVVQEVMVTDVYLSEAGGVSLVTECGFGEGEVGYVTMQCAMAEHQGDPLITQYVGSSMMKLLEAAGIDMQALQQGGQ